MIEFLQINKTLKFNIPMKTQFTKILFSLMAIMASVLLNSTAGFAQWTQPLGINGAVGALRVTSSGGSVAGNNSYAGSAFYGTNDIGQAALNGDIDATINAIGPGFRFKATAGKPDTITIEIALNVFAPYYDSSVTNYNWLNGGIGFDGTTFDSGITIPFVQFYNSPRLYVYKGVYTFSKARPRGWILFGFEILQDNALQKYTMVLPFIVDGVKEPDVPLVMNGSVPRIITQPELPITVLHAPPGDQSYTKFEINKTACQSVENSITEDLANSGNGSVKLGYKGSIGFIVHVDVEAYVEFTGSGTDGNKNVKIKSNETCISSTTGFGATPGSGEDIFLCEGLDYNYAVYDQLFINPAANNYSTYTKSGLVMLPIDGSKRLNLFTRTNILDQIEQRRLDTLNASLPLKQRIDAKNQLNVWKQLITLNDANVANATIPNPDYSLINLNGGAPVFDRTTSISTNQTNTLIVDHYIEGNVGLQAVVNIGGSGFSAGYNLRTSKSYGKTTSTTNSNTQTMTMHLEDNDAGDLLNINIYRDPMFGTPLFKLQAGSKTSCPYEGGYQRDQPSLQIFGSNQNTVTIPNITLGTPANFQVKICNNNSTESRTYNMGFVSQTNSSDLLITAAGSTGSQFGSFTVPANTCRVENYDVNISRRYPTSDVNFSNLEFQLFPSCDPTIKSSIFANVNFSAPPLPANVAASTNTACTGTPVTLTASCAVTTTPTWYTQAVGGFPVAVGSSVTVNPSVNTTYYVGCETANYVRNRVATKLVLVGTPSTVLNLTTNYTTGSTLQIATNTITATNKVISPAYAVYKAGKSISFGPGFEARSGSLFAAQIGGCN